MPAVIRGLAANNLCHIVKPLGNHIAKPLTHGCTVYKLYLCVRIIPLKIKPFSICRCNNTMCIKVFCKGNGISKGNYIHAVLVSKI